MSDEQGAESSSDIVKTTTVVRYPRSLAASRRHSDVEGHEFDEEDPQERMFHINIACSS